MSKTRPSRRVIRSLCADPGPGDGVDPKLEPRGDPPGAAHRKARQLCAQAAKALALALASTPDDEVAGLVVLSVEPGPDTSRLVVTVAQGLGASCGPAELLARLDRHAPRLRAEVTRAITRRRAPTLAFRLALG